MATRTDWINKLNRISTGDGSWESKLERVLFLPLIALALQLANVLEAVLNLFIIPLNSLISGVGELIGAILGGGARIVGAGAAGSAGQVELFGILAFPLAIAIALGAAAVYAWYTDLEFTSDLIPFTSTDWWIIGNDEEGEDQ